MKQAAYFILMIAAALVVIQCSDSSDQPVAPAPHKTLNSVDSRVLQANNAFAFNVFKSMYNAESGKNLFISPLSISIALGMTLNGARGETYNEMQTTLALQGLTNEEINTNYRRLLDLLPALDPAVDIGVANSIWTRLGYPVMPAFLEINKTSFDAVVREIDFDDEGAADIINAWVNEKTRGRIDAIVDKPIPAYVVMYLINAVYFKAAWQITFDKELTKPAMFNTFGGPQRSIDMMSRSDSMLYFESSTYQAVDLPYGNGAYTMTILLPKEYGQAAFDSMIDGLTQESWTAITSSFTDQKVVLSMPKFTLRYEKDLNDILKAMGMPTAFTAAADFSGINPDDQLFISKVRHKSFVEVNEQGTEAAAVTSVEIGRTSVDPDIYFVTLNRPFLYSIRERETGTIIFTGALMNPSE